ncbi:MAG: RpiB/LacA/LacB family sugar-phosphate isomerase [Rickettsiales bacterium]|nr:RpiB/LacA/LacB family sugar-phosphate isomerase [Rickettsiales bacterium]
MVKVSNLFIASDHAGYELKSFLLDQLREYNVIDLGTDSSDSVDYPDFANALSVSIKSFEDFGILICGTGIGISIAANRHSHIRAALCEDVERAKLAREHNNANVIVFGARFVEASKALESVKAFLSSEFLKERHQIRVNKL